MTKRKWREVDLASLYVPDAGWRYNDTEMALKLAASVRRHGQLRALVVRTSADGSTEIVKGRHLAAALREAGLERGMAVDLGKVQPDEARVAALALELGFEIDFARLALAVAALLKGGATAADLSMGSPFTPERIGYFGTLATFDWSAFAEETHGQVGMDWDASEAPPESEGYGSESLPVQPPAGTLSPSVASPPAVPAAPAEAAAEGRLF